ncbi:porin family protein [Sphingomonas koreensis]|jgi:outer membrane immunogenic protein|uniref:Opacity protein n=1 Tax=Sphingomonas koreensis TaxID=93064 RepID=A0A1L6J8W7_9SPHN|nr:outer membrane beta-barrel protein [Sphingomonas koreensis]APR52391.1 opacity protein [Sphingomonas koreensis]MDC7811549.1 outer membrane beta-barrel protein [Sphingomonas koreensis]PJI88146.1 outer membrane immunogenic protein [Sphingomonas koreensis]RSU19719.1 porin family protein [Sphingomonas koreensis]RSU26507.1 porin family protein [Sphingomonas koreensis]
MRKLVLAALAASAMATPAFAQDTSFTGPRIEALVGYDTAKDGTGQDAGSSDGVTYGGAIGYDFQIGGAVIGAEAELTGSSVDTRADSLLVAGDRLVTDMGRDIYVGARAGVAITPTTLLYAKGGYTNAKVNTTYEVGNTKTEISDDMEGFRIGAGAEFKLSSNMYLKGEYRYSNYGKIDGYDIDIDRHQVVAGVGIRF